MRTEIKEIAVKTAQVFDGDRTHVLWNIYYEKKAGVASHIYTIYGFPAYEDEMLTKYSGKQSFTCNVGLGSVTLKYIAIKRDDASVVETLTPILQKLTAEFKTGQKSNEREELIRTKFVDLMLE